MFAGRHGNIIVDVGQTDSDDHLSSFLNGLNHLFAAEEVKALALALALA